jgi:hypothetical protein
MAVVNLLVGILLVFYGRTLYWLFIAVAGFLMGMELATVLLPDVSEGMRLLLALLAGVAGALVGIVAQRIAFAIAGLFAGGYLGLLLARSFAAPGEPMIWFAVGAVLGSILASSVMDWAIIVLSSLVGSAAITDQFVRDRSLATLVFLAIAVVGIVVQARRPKGSV